MKEGKVRQRRRRRREKRMGGGKGEGRRMEGKKTKKMDEYFNTL